MQTRKPKAHRAEAWSIRRHARAFALALAALPLAAAGSPAKAGSSFTYVGASRCRICHSTERIGAQSHVWAASRHAKAFETLATDKARAMAKKRGIADPQKAPQCLACHVTGHGEPSDRFSPTYAVTEGVSCEGCHGPGSGYSKISVMQGIRRGRLRAQDYGLTVGDKTVCARCHNQNPLSGGFVDWPRDSAAIAHPIPAGYVGGDQGTP